MASVKSYNSNITTGGQLTNELSKVRDVTIEYKGYRGFWIQGVVLDRLERQVKEIEEKGSNSVSPTALKNLNDEIQALRAKSATQDAVIEASRATEAKLNKDLKQLRSSTEAQKHVTGLEKARLSSEKEKLKSELDRLRVESTDFKKQGRPGADATPQTRDAYDAKVRSLSQESQRVNNILEGLNNDYKNQTAAYNKALRDVEKLEADLVNEKALQERAIGKTYADVIKEPLKEMEPVPEPDSFTLKKAFSPEVMSSLNSYAAAKREDYRERAHKLMEIANQVDAKNFVGYKAYATALFHKVRASSPEDRGKFAQVLDDLWSSTVLKAGPRLKTVKQQYNSLFEQDETVQSEEIKETAGQENWWQALKFDFWFYRKTSNIWWREQKEKIWGKLPEQPSLWVKFKSSVKVSKTWFSSFFHWGSSVIKID